MALNWNRIIDGETPVLGQPLNDLADAVIAAENDIAKMQNATATAESVSSDTPPSVSVEMTQSGFEFAFEIPQGEKGADGADGADGAQGEKGDKGDKGDNGESPEITVEEITGGHRVTIYDAEHPQPQGQSFDVMDGSAADVSSKMDKTNPTGTGAMSLNRAADSSVGRMSAVLGSGNTATEQFGISLGFGNLNDGQASLAAGSSNRIKKTSATNSLNTVTLGMSLQAQGNAQIVLGKHNKPMEDLVGAYPKYPLVFGWGTTQSKKNILVMDNEGNAEFSGKVTANGKELANKDDIGFFERLLKKRFTYDGAQYEFYFGMTWGDLIAETFVPNTGGFRLYFDIVQDANGYNVMKDGSSARANELIAPVEYLPDSE